MASQHPRWRRRAVWTVAIVLVVAVAAAVAFSQRPVTSPRYDASTWEGAASSSSGWLDVEQSGSTFCFYLATGDTFEPDTRVGLVLPTTYRAFQPALAELGLSGPGLYISGSSLWAGEQIARPLYDVRIDGREAAGEAWLDDARAEWDARCPSTEVVWAVAPGGLAVE